jgi:2-isopropylmalate synthase
MSEHAGVGPVKALTDALHRHGVSLEILELHRTSVGTGNDNDALTVVEYRGHGGTGWAAGRSRSVLAASMAAVLRAASYEDQQLRLAPAAS